MCSYSTCISIQFTALWFPCVCLLRTCFKKINTGLELAIQQVLSNVVHRCVCVKEKRSCACTRSHCCVLTATRHQQPSTELHRHQTNCQHRTIHLCAAGGGKSRSLLQLHRVLPTLVVAESPQPPHNSFDHLSHSTSEALL